MAITTSELKKTRFGDIWFEDRYGEIRDPNYDDKEKIEMIFRHLVWRIQEAEKMAAFATAQDMLKAKLDQLKKATDENEKRAIENQVINLKKVVEAAQGAFRNFVDIDAPHDLK